MKKSIKIKLIIGAILFTALFVMNGRMSTKSMSRDITLSQLTVSNADFSERYFPCGSVECGVEPFLVRCISGYYPICYCYCETYYA